MTVAELMQLYPAPDPEFKGFLMNDDNVIAVNFTGEADADPNLYTVVQEGIAGFDPQLNAGTSEKTYIRAGTSTSKTTTQRTFGVTGDRYIGDPFQDHIFTIDQIYGVGEDVNTDYVWFNLKNGKGERGRVAVIVNSDGSGNAGENAGIDVALRKVGAKPTEYTYAPVGP